MADSALERCEAYVARTAGPPGRAQVKAVAERLRYLEPTHDASLALIVDHQVALEGAYAEIGRLAQAHADDQAFSETQAAAMRSANKALRLRVQELQTAKLQADQMLGERTAPPACVSMLDAWAVFVAAALGGWLVHG